MALNIVSQASGTGFAESTRAGGLYTAEASMEALARLAQGSDILRSRRGKEIKFRKCRRKTISLSWTGQDLG